MDDENSSLTSSRIYVHGLPVYLDEKRLREVFSERGDVTDAKIIRTKDGRSRQFGFVGFVDAEQAQSAIDFFDKSYLDTSRLGVKFAEKTDSAKLGRPWSKHSKGSTAFQKRQREVEEQTEGGDGREKTKKAKKSAAKGAEPEEEDPQLVEFLKVMQPRRAAAIWSNDDTVADAPQPAVKIGSREKKKAQKLKTAAAEAAAEEEEDSLYQDLPAAAEKRAEGGSKKKSKKKADRKANTEPEPSGTSRERDAVLEDAGVSDMDYLKSRKRTRTFEEDDKEADVGEESNTPESKERSSDEEAEGDDSADHSADEGTALLEIRRKGRQKAGPSGDGGDDAPVLVTGRLFLRNLPYTAAEADIAKLCAEYGELSEVHLVVDRQTNKSKGFALVQFVKPRDAVTALAALDGSIFQGRLLHVLPGQPPKNSHSEADGEGEPPEEHGFRKQREAEQKQDAGNRAAWNSLFMRPDTVAQAIAAHYGVSKSQLLDKEAADLPVRMALGEAHVVALTKSSLAEAGVAVDALEKAAAAGGMAAKSGLGIERSDTTLLVKNLPYSATEAELHDVVGKGGRIARLVLAKPKTLAVVEFQNPTDARRAFKSLAYKKFQNVPLFLEWAPKGIFNAEAPPSQAKTAAEEAHRDSSEAETTAVDVAALRGNVNDEYESSSIHVKNLAWATSEKVLLRHFDPVVSAIGGSVRAVKIAVRKGQDGKTLSAGYGFVECSSAATAKITLRKLQGSKLDGHKLELQLSMKKSAGKVLKPLSVKRKGDASQTTKVVVRNIAFEATAKEIRALFQPFAQIKSVRLPRKFDNSHRGFAFVDFLSHQEAVNATEAVAGTHLYGRRLVCEWADDNDSGLDDLRAKTAAKYRGDVSEAEPKRKEGAEH